MDEIQYIGEHLFPGQLGHFFVVIGFIASFVSALYYFLGVQKGDYAQGSSWVKLGKWAFAIHGLSIIGIILMLFYMMLSQYYEYQYVWSHVSDDLPFRYIFSAFWEGQEGSFLLWMFWHVVLGIIFITRKSKWEAPVMSVLSLVQFILVGMILGVYFSDAVKIGSSPFLLLRDTMNAPIFNNAQYLSLIQGNGLNPLLQNYWMTIHPPYSLSWICINHYSILFCGIWTLA